MFTPGELVQLKSGGAKMVVASVADDEVSCIWQEAKGKAHVETRKEYPSVVLQPYKAPAISMTAVRR